MFALAIFGSFVLYLVIGAAVGRKVKNTDDYYVAGRNAPTFLVAGTLVASFLSSVSFMGELGFSYDGYPVVLLLLTAINISGYAIGVLIFGRYLRRSEALTVPEYFGKRFDSKTVQAVAGLMVVVGIGFYLIAVTHGLALVVGQLVDLPHWSILLIVWAAYTVFTLLSGSRGILINDTIMFVVFTLAGIIGMAWVIGSAGGPYAATQKMAQLIEKPDALSWHGLTGENAYMGEPWEVLLYAVTLGVVWATVVAVSPWQSSRYLMAKNEHVAMRSGLFATGALLITYLFLTFGGFSINLIKSDIEPSEIAFIWVAQNHLPAVLGVIAITGIVAAGLSSAASFLSLIGFSAANDILPAFSRGHSGARDYPATTADSGATQIQVVKDVKLRTSRIVMLVTGLVVLGCTFVVPPVLMTIAYFAATLFAASWGPVAIWSTQSARITARGAAWGMIAGFVVSAALQWIDEFTDVTLPTLMDPVILGMTASVLGVVLGNIGQRPSQAALDFFDKIRTVPQVERNPRELAWTRRMVWTVSGICLVVIALLIVFYAIPYSQVIG